MKIDRRDPRHWLYLAASALWVLVALVLRPFRPRGRRPRVLLYGHKLGGNLLAIHRYLRAAPGAPEVAFLTLDPAYHRELRGAGEPSVLATSPRCLAWLATADALVSDHGLHTLRPLQLSDLKFFDAWHAIPFKGFDADDFRVQHRYEETWVASPLLAGLYRSLYEFPADRIVVTGYARTDRLVREKHHPTAAIRERLGLPADAGKVVLFAPTWKQDSEERSLFPFGIESDAFCAALSGLACRLGATVILRTHLNSGPGAVDVSRHARLMSLPYADYPDTEEILLATDVLVCDWSSIAFDFLLLERPAIFLEVPPPFRKGFTLGPEYRYGEVVAGLPAMLAAIEAAVSMPAGYAAKHGERAEAMRQAIYGGFDDGNASARCVARLERALAVDPERG